MSSPEKITDELHKVERELYARICFLQQYAKNNKRERIKKVGHTRECVRQLIRMIERGLVEAKSVDGLVQEIREELLPNTVIPDEYK